MSRYANTLSLMKLV